MPSDDVIKKLELAGGIMGAIAALAQLVAKSLGKTASEVLTEVAADCDQVAKDPTDESDAAAERAKAKFPKSD